MDLYRVLDIGKTPRKGHVHALVCAVKSWHCQTLTFVKIENLTLSMEATRTAFIAVQLHLSYRKITISPLQINFLCLKFIQHLITFSLIYHHNYICWQENVEWAEWRYIHPCSLCRRMLGWNPGFVVTVSNLCATFNFYWWRIQAARRLNIIFIMVYHTENLDTYWSKLRQRFFTVTMSYFQKVDDENG